ncbi:hypothetical protein KY338_06010 [Candidatus Woesearchaeota archaeon]|nr:hypothetical protein [Candidatus Woesearchaeota archaeon]MBW3005879.1 hypothetical protein [Candidatus Woesearchaeota archaeon]
MYATTSGPQKIKAGPELQSKKKARYPTIIWFLPMDIKARCLFVSLVL